MSNYNRKDKFYRQAKEEGYRSRAAYKLVELNKKYRFLKTNSRVIDLGAWPGGWLQVAERIVGSEGCLVGIDLVPIEPLSERVHLIAGDVREELAKALAFAGGSFSVCLSDMSPKLSGIPEADRAATASSAELAWSVAKDALSEGGVFVVKLFRGHEADIFVKEIKRFFQRVAREELESTRATSNEFYAVGLGYKPCVS